MSNHAASRRAKRVFAAGVLTASTMAGLIPALPTSASAASLTAPIYKITAEGMTPDQSQSFAERAGVGNALRPDGSFSFTDARYAKIPLRTVAKGRDENGNPTVSQALDSRALAAIKPLSLAEAKERASGIMDLPKAYGAIAVSGNTMVEQADKEGRNISKTPIDATVSYRLTLGGKPVIGPGAKAKVSFDSNGGVLQLTKAVRDVESAGTVAIIGPEEAMKSCQSLYGARVSQNTPLLSYYAPPLAADKADGVGVAEFVLPQYICQPATTKRDEVSRFTGKMVAAAPDLAPIVHAKADTDGRTVVAAADVVGGTAPFTFQWSSSSALLGAEHQRSEIRYAQGTRSKLAEVLRVTVTDANGQTSVATLALGTEPRQPASATAAGVAGGQSGSFGTAGIEQTVDEWQCAQDSAIGFKAEMQAHSQTVKFDWRGNNAWERDFKKTSLGGTDTSWVDSVDAQWYTGHGSPGSFTFKTNQSDRDLVPGDAKWGDTNLEWLQLESCQVLRDTTGTLDHFGRWGPTMDGLHLLNGFHTNATCVGGGTGRRFAEYLFPQEFLWWTIRPALTVQQAWARMADDLEPAGTRWRSMSLVASGGVNNLGDFYWGQGPTGPDIAFASRTGMISVSGVS